VVLTSNRPLRLVFFLAGLFLHIIINCTCPGHPKANYKIASSGLRPTPASMYIDRLYIEAGFYVIGGANVRINQKEKSTRLARGSDYPSLLNEMAKQFVSFYDVSDRKAWLIDGASALLHLVRVSLQLDESDPESNYDWKFDKTKLMDVWPGIEGRHAARKTLTHWDNLTLPVYVKNQAGPSGATVTQYSTFQDRVNKVLHSLEILVDLQAYTVSMEGIKIPQSRNVHKAICGFDMLDVLGPLGPISTRIKRFEFWGDGWMDFLPTAGVVTVFGKGFGELIRPDNPQDVCPIWQAIPNGEDYLISTVSTLKLLQKRLESQNSLSETGDLTSKISWRTLPNARNMCKCAEAEEPKNCPDPVHFMVSKSWIRKWKSSAFVPVDIDALNPDGAVVFANLSLTGQRMYAKKAKTTKVKAGSATILVDNSTGVSESLGASTVSTGAFSAGQLAPSTVATEFTEASNDTNSQGFVQGQQNMSKGKTKKLKEAWGSIFKRLPL
jgi:hypothetical protein